MVISNTNHNSHEVIVLLIDSLSSLQKIGKKIDNNFPSLLTSDNEVLSFLTTDKIFIVANLSRNNCKRLNSTLSIYQELVDQLKKFKCRQFCIINNALTNTEFTDLLLKLACLQYSFAQFVACKKEIHNIERVFLFESGLKDNEIVEINTIIQNSLNGLDLLHMPGSSTSPQEFLNIIKKENRNNLTITSLNKQDIIAERLNGVITVNKGSCNDECVEVLNYSGKYAKNDKPLIFAGKGVIFDSGGTNLKRSETIGQMKYDKMGASVVVTLLKIISVLQIPVNVIGIIPLVENRISQQSFLPGDIIKMHNGKTVEVINTDAEGRIILADIVSYCAQFNPELIVTIGTFTNTNLICGKEYIISMGNAKKATEKFENISKEFNLKLHNLPFDDDYHEHLISDIADVKNLNMECGAPAIYAGKFIEYFTSYPYVNIDAGGCINTNQKTINATFINLINLLLNFIKK